MNASVEAVDGYIVLKFRKFLVDEGDNGISISGTQNFIYVFSNTVGEGYESNRGKAVMNIRSGGTSKVSDPNQGKRLDCGILEGLAWVFLALLGVGSALLQYFSPTGPTSFNIYE